jgi:hypothetical protein
MSTYPTIAASASLLERAGWSAKEWAVHQLSGTVWLVTARWAGNVLAGRGATQAEAWHRACLHAEALGPGAW